MLPARMQWSLDSRPTAPAPVIQSLADLPAEGALVIEGSGTFQAALEAGYGFDTYWLRDAGWGKLEAEYGARLDIGAKASLTVSLSGHFRAELSRTEDSRLRCRLSRGSRQSVSFAPRLSVTVEGTRAGRAPDQPAGEPVVRKLGEVFAAAHAAAPALQESLAGLRDRIYARAHQALEKKFTVNLSYLWEKSSAGSALLDAVFAFTPEGLAAFGRLMAGDCWPALLEDSPHHSLNEALLTHELRRETRLELHLPFLGRRESRAVTETIGRLAVEAGGDGRVLVYSVEASDKISRNRQESMLALSAGIVVGRAQPARFTLGYSDRRRLEPPAAAAALGPLLAAYEFPAEALDWAAAAGGPVEAAVTLTIPGEAAAAWLAAPGPREAGYLPVYGAMSIAVQAALRRWLPYVYFSDVSRYDDTGAAFPLLVYQATRPYPGKTRAELTYDVLNPDTMAAAYRSAFQNLPALLEKVETALKAAGKRGAAEFYGPGHSRQIIEFTRRDRRLFQSLLVADAFFLDNLVHLALKGAEVRAQLAADPQRALRALTRFAEDFVRTFHSKLRRLYGGQEFLAFGSLLLLEASAALDTALGSGRAIQGSLRLAAPGKEITFVNAHYRP